MNGLETQAERFSSILAEFQAMVPLHWQETPFQGAGPLDIDYDFYLGLERSGHLRCVTIRSSGVLMGYWIGIVRKHPHYRTVLCAFTDADYTSPDFRWAAFYLYRRVERLLKAEGVQFITQRAKPEANKKWRFLEACGFHLNEFGYVKAI